jgi:hypothetical protein
MTDSQYLSVSWHLSEWDEGDDFETILSKIENPKDYPETLTDPNEDYQYHNAKSLIYLIRALADEVDYLVAKV